MENKAPECPSASLWGHDSGPVVKEEGWTLISVPQGSIRHTDCPYLSPRGIPVNVQETGVGWAPSTGAHAQQLCTVALGKASH